MSDTVKYLIIAGLAALLLASGLALKSAYKENGRLETKLETVTNANKSNQETIDELEIANIECVENRELDRAENMRILRELRADLDTANAEREKQRRIIDEIYETSEECGEWGRGRVCPAIAERLLGWPADRGNQDGREAGREVRRD